MRLADASIWVHQFIKTMRAADGEVLRNAHLLGFFRRICKSVALLSHWHYFHFQQCYWDLYSHSGLLKASILLLVMLAASACNRKRLTKVPSVRLCKLKVHSSYESPFLLIAGCSSITFVRSLSLMAAHQLSKRGQQLLAEGNLPESSNILFNKTHTTNLRCLQAFLHDFW